MDFPPTKISHFTVSRTCACATPLSAVAPIPVVPRVQVDSKGGAGKMGGAIDVSQARKNNCLTWFGQFTKLRFCGASCVKHRASNTMHTIREARVYDFRKKRKLRPFRYLGRCGSCSNDLFRLTQPPTPWTGVSRNCLQRW